jgi:hypothetical protein
MNSFKVATLNTASMLLNEGSEEGVEPAPEAGLSEDGSVLLKCVAATACAAWTSIAEIVVLGEDPSVEVEDLTSSITAWNATYATMAMPTIASAVHQRC